MDDYECDNKIPTVLHAHGITKSNKRQIDPTYSIKILHIQPITILARFQQLSYSRVLSREPMESSLPRPFR